MSTWLTRNWGLKIISLVLAVALWYYAIGEENIEITRMIPLKIEVENPQMSVLKASAKTVQVTLSAPRSLLVNLATQDIQAVHKIGQEIKTAGEYSFRLEKDEIRLPSFQIRVIDIYPETITIRLDELIAQKLEIEPEFVGEPAVGYKVPDQEIQMNPNAVLAQGPKGELEKMTSVKTEPIDLVGRIRSFHRTVEVRLPPNVKSLSETLVDVYIPIREEFDEKEFKDIPVRILKAPGENGTVELNPENISFVLKGSKRYLEKLSPENLLIYADLAGLKKGEHEVVAQVMLPENISLKEKKPITVKVNIGSSKS